MRLVVWCFLLSLAACVSQSHAGITISAYDHYIFPSRNISPGKSTPRNVLGSTLLVLVSWPSVADCASILAGCLLAQTVRCLRPRRWVGNRKVATSHKHCKIPGQREPGSVKSGSDNRNENLTHTQVVISSGSGRKSTQENILAKLPAGLQMDLKALGKKPFESSQRL